MKIVGLTGGIGSGKTTVASMFQALGISIYIADEEAKKLMASSKVIKRKLIALFGEKAYVNEQLNKPFIADTIFKNSLFLEKMNAIIHPRVASHFKKWLLKQKSPYVIKEAAILFENEGYKQCDLIITVTAPKELKIKRLLSREHMTVEKIEAIMNNQWNDAKKMKLSDYVIINAELENTRQQVAKIHQQIVDKL